MPGYNHYPDCTCGWCSGGGGGGYQATVVPAPLPTAGTRSTWDSGDFCRPSSCPICGADVFFVRHNGGSVWFDELGPPWPKHACFDDEYDGSRLRRTLREESRENPHPVFGVVIETEVIEPGKNGRIMVRCSDRTMIDDTFRTKLNLTHYVGALVIIERAEDGTISLRQISSSSSCHWRPRPRLAEGAQITFDGRGYIWNGRQWYGASDYIIAPTGLQQRLTALVAERLRSTDDRLPRP
jgi:hypothetical protein